MSVNWTRTGSSNSPTHAKNGATHYNPWVKSTFLNYNFIPFNGS